MTKPLEERLRFRLLRAVLFVSNIVSLIIDLLIVVFGKKFLKLIVANELRDATSTWLRIFAAIEVVIALLALFGIVLRSFYVFTAYTTLLVVYLLAAAVFTRVPFTIFFLFGFILVILASIFSYMLWTIKERRKNNPYNV